MYGPAIDTRKIFSLMSDLCQAARIFRNDAVFCEGVTFSQFLVLDAPATREEMKMSDIHSLLSVEKSTSTRVVGPLIDKGLVIRKKADHDLRATYLSITEEGEERYRKIWDCFTEYSRRTQENIAPSEREKAYVIIRNFINSILETSPIKCCNNNK